MSTRPSALLFSDRRVPRRTSQRLPARPGRRAGQAGTVPAAQKFQDLGLRHLAGAQVVGRRGAVDVGAHEAAPAELLAPLAPSAGAPPADPRRTGGRRRRGCPCRTCAVTAPAPVHSPEDASLPQCRRSCSKRSLGSQPPGQKRPFWPLPTRRESRPSGVNKVALAITRRPRLPGAVPSRATARSGAAHGTGTSASGARELSTRTSPLSAEGQPWPLGSSLVRLRKLRRGGGPLPGQQYGSHRSRQFCRPR